MTNDREAMQKGMRVFSMNNPSPLRYPGGKSRFYSYVKNILIANRLVGQTYIEPFAGGAGLALRLLLSDDVERIVINDFDQAIYAFWYSVLHKADDLCQMIHEVPLTTCMWQQQRQIYLAKNTRNLLKLGFATFFLNRTNMSGVIKGGLIGGQFQQGRYTMDARFNKTALIERIQIIYQHRTRIDLFNLDAKELLQQGCLKQYRRALINFDPPYVAKGAQLYKNSFQESDHRELARLISRLRRKWIVTYDVCPLISSLYDQFRSGCLNVNYSIQSHTRSKEYIFFSDNLLLPENIQLSEKERPICTP
ncbi:MAG: DNA adenine methylase [Thermoguttaceae bacterium]|nr:DNA adenine methylase [Thermoguttaceae bacterium]